MSVLVHHLFVYKHLYSLTYVVTYYEVHFFHPFGELNVYTYDFTLSVIQELGE